MLLSAGMSLSKPSTVPAGNFAKASSEGAKTVKGPLPFSVSINPAAVSAAARVVNLPAATAVLIISCIGQSSNKFGFNEFDALRLNNYESEA